MDIKLAELLVDILQNITSKEILEKENAYLLDEKNLVKMEFTLHGNKLGDAVVEKELDYFKRVIPHELNEIGRQVESTTKHDNFRYNDKINFYELVDLISSNLLQIKQGEIVYRYEHFQTWNYISGKIGTNLLVSNAYAFKDIIDDYFRKVFDWKSMIDHDNYRLNQVLERGLSDNHFHLLGSAPYFSLSWISLMNKVLLNKSQTRTLQELNKEIRNPRLDYLNHQKEDDFTILHLKAAAIRAYLYAFLTKQHIELGNTCVSIAWLLGLILEKADEKGVFKEIIFEDLSDVQMQDVITKLISEDGEEYIKVTVPDLWKFLWELFPDIPIKVLVEKHDLFSRRNISGISDYIEKYYAGIPIGECLYLFSDISQEEVYSEWDRITQRELEHMLKDTKLLLKSRNNIQQIIDRFHLGDQVKDYALNQIDYVSSDRPIYACGERWLIYSMLKFRYVFQSIDYVKYEKHYNYFFAYLAMKERFRMELIQNNEKIGFENFQKYQNRKMWFSTVYTVGDFARIAVEESFALQSLKSLEVRVIPEKKWQDNVQLIRYYDAYIQKMKDMYYVFHFPKLKDKTKWNGRLFSSLYRHEAYRNALKQKAFGITLMRENNPVCGERVKGIDACSSEDGCRPEVFSTVFRTLKSHIVYTPNGDKALEQLRVSYHVGEDNQDVLDGLRAIDEAIKFLNLDSEDRLGHATLLGIDVEKWYADRNHTILIRQQDYLDNIAWLYNKINKYHISNQDNLLEYLLNEFYVYFNRIYEIAFDQEYISDIVKEREIFRSKKQSDKNLSMNARKPVINFNIYNYYASWALRGDDPELYKNGYCQYRGIVADIWSENRINKKKEIGKRDIPEAEILYHYYHYNNVVRMEGEKPIMVKIPKHMQKGIAAVQKQMQRKIAKRGIAIETNPSSNLMIAGLGSYTEHPILRFYNKGLSMDAELEWDCPQINVSINTDDQGVFVTSLKNEYTLMAGSLEFAEDSDGNRLYKKDKIYDWMELIRQMGNSQKFIKQEAKENV